MNWCYNGREYEHDILKHGQVRALLDSFDSIEAPLKELIGLNYDEMPISEVREKYKQNCEIIRNFFTSLFGEEAAREICGEKNSEHIEAMISFLKYLKVEIGRFQEDKGTV